MEQRETLEAELAELAGRRDGFSAEQAEVTKARDAALVEIDRELDGERSARDGLVPKVGEQLRALYDQIRARQGGVGTAALVGNTCQGCRVSISPVELAAIRKLPTRGDQAARTAAGSWWSRVTPTDVVVWTDGVPGKPGAGRLRGGGDHPRRGGAGRVGGGHRLGDQQRGRVPGRDRRAAPGQELGARRVRVRADSLLVVNQQKGLWKVKNAGLRPPVGGDGRPGPRVRPGRMGARPRERNRRADALANRAMDDQGRVVRPRPGARDPEQLRRNL